MAKKIIIVIVALLSGVIILVIKSGQGKGSFQYVGANVCGECHGEDSIGNQNRIWLASPHAKAFTGLAGRKAADIAARYGVKNPQSDVKCLKCHTTGGGQSIVTAREGVGCEACHGPGSDYYRANVHVDFVSRENGYMRAVRAGMYPIMGIKALKLREKMCLACHDKTRPCFPENGNVFDYMIPIQTVDTLQKGNVNFRHPLRR